jgi:hypothetical protein
MPVLATRRRGRTPVAIIRDATLYIKSQEGGCRIARPAANAGFPFSPRTITEARRRSVGLGIFRD